MRADGLSPSCAANIQSEERDGTMKSVQDDRGATAASSSAVEHRHPDVGPHETRHPARRRTATPITSSAITRNDPWYVDAI